MTAIPLGSRRKAASLIGGSVMHEKATLEENNPNAVT